MKSHLTKFFLILLGFSLIIGCQNDDAPEQQNNRLENKLKETLVSLFGSLSTITLPESNDYIAIPNDPNNTITEEKVLLGKSLFHETAMAQNQTLEIGRGTYSCASCHHSAAGFQSGLKQGIGEGGLGFGFAGEERRMNPMYNESQIDVQPIRSPTILNTAYQNLMLWNGQFGATGKNTGTESNWTEGTPKAVNNLGFEGVETQAIAGIGVHRIKCDKETIKNSPYRVLFDSAFPNIPEEERYSDQNAGLAIAAFERTVLANKSPFQNWLKGKSGQMTKNEIEGALLFFGKGKCYECHSGPGLNGMNFHALGMNDLMGDKIHGTVDEATSKGRGGFTNNPNDDYKFKTPTIYNLKDVLFLGHGGSFSNVREVIEYKNTGIAQNNSVPKSKLSPLFKPLGLTNTEIDQLTAFVENSLYDSELSRYVPENTPLNSCFPNADEQSRKDMDCD